MNVVLTREQVRRIDQRAVTRYQIPSLILMENAGRNAAGIIDVRFGPAGTAVILCGTGNNGGDGCVIARHLHNLGWRTRLLILGGPGSMTPDALTNFRIIEATGIEYAVVGTGDRRRQWLSTIQPTDVIVDALLGTGFRGLVRSPQAELIQGVNEIAKRAVIAVDVPSGLDCDTGEPANAVIRADLTITFVAAKKGFSMPVARPFLGEVVVADIGAPRELIAEIANAQE
jgi:NAD(P)H-hydrate epimerase